jgi:F-type H+-transporting ATPase subunit a
MVNLEIRVGEHITGHLLGLPFHWDTLIQSWVIMLGLILVSLFVTRRLNQERPHGLQNILETIMEFLREQMAENVGPAGRGAFPFVSSLFLFILFSNLIGLFGVPGTTEIIKSPTEDLGFTIAMALLVFGSMLYYGIKVQGLKKYILSFFKPNFLFFPIHLIDLLVKPVTLAFRLFGNIFAGAVFLLILFKLLPAGPPVIALIIGIFVGVIQAYLFMMLAMAYISSAMEDSMEDEEAQEKQNPQIPPASEGPGVR